MMGCALLLTTVLNTIPADVALEESLCQASREERFSPARWKCEFVSSAYIQRLRAQLLKKQEIPPEEMRQVLVSLQREIESGKNFPPPPNAAIPCMRNVSPPKIDGLPDDPAWAQSLTYHGEVPLNGRISAGNAVWKIIYDQTFLYFYAHFDDNDLQGNRNNPYMADSFELFLLPDYRLGSYLELVFPAPGTVGRFYSRRAFARPGDGTYRIEEFILPATNLQYALQRNATGFSIEGKIAFRELPGYFLGNAPKVGEKLFFMMVRTNLEHGVYSRSTPVPFLYDGHNIYGYIRGTLEDAAIIKPIKRNGEDGDNKINGTRDL